MGPTFGRMSRHEGNLALSGAELKKQTGNQQQPHLEQGVQA